MASLIFISARSADYQYAQQIYNFLKTHGLQVFFSQESLPELASSDYRKQIDNALDGAQHMIVVTSSVENVTSSWVEAEWGLFINEKRSGRKSGNLITVIAGNLTPGNLPASLRYYEVIPYDPRAFDKVFRYVTAPVNEPPPATTQTIGSQTLRHVGSPGAGGAKAAANTPANVQDPARSVKAIAVRAPASSERDLSAPAEKGTKNLATKLKYGAIIGALLGASNSMLAGFYEVAHDNSRLNPIIPALIGLVLGAMFGSVVAASMAGRIVGIAALVIAGIIGAANEGPSASVGMGLLFGTTAAVLAAGLTFLVKGVLLKR